VRLEKLADRGFIVDNQDTSQCWGHVASPFERVCPSSSIELPHRV
jgi:hypothetical protein